MNAKDLKMDYFQIYNLENPQKVKTIFPTIKLQGQFDKKEAEFAELQYLKKIATPVRKNNEEYYNKRDHLTWYNMESSDPAKAIKVDLENQFGRQKIVIYGVVGLLVPAKKKIIDSTSVFPKKTKIDHYKIYRVVKQTPLKGDFTLKDQFQKRRAKLSYAMAFAVPVKKTHGRKYFKINNKEAHLTIYYIDYSKDIPALIKTRDQIGSYHYLKVGKSFLLAVPSLKTRWKILD